MAVLLSAAAALAIWILLFGDFGATEGRILATTALLGGYALLALPAAILRDQRRLPVLAAVVIALALAAASLGLVAVWQDEPSDTLGNAVWTATAWLAAAVQTAALAARRGEPDPRSVRRLFAASTLVVAAVAAMFTVLLWAELDSESYGRTLAALVVLDVLLVALQPILARAGVTGGAYRIRVVTVGGETVELDVEASGLPAAAAKAIRTLEREGRPPRLLELAGRDVSPPVATGGRGAGRRSPADEPAARGRGPR